MMRVVANYEGDVTNMLESQRKTKGGLLPKVPYAKIEYVSRDKLFRVPASQKRLEVVYLKSTHVWMMSV